MSTVTEPTRGLVAENIGPVERVSIPCPPDGGVVVLKGKNGSGKTTLLDATESLVTGRGKLSVRDGQLHGKMAGLGAAITVARSTRRSGELEVTSLDGRLSPAELVDPGMKDPDAADAKRIKALVALVGAKADASLFYGLLGGQAAFEAAVGGKAIDSDDLITMASRIKRDLESKARNEEDRAEHAEGHANGSREAAVGVDVTSECDAAKLQAELEHAVRNEEKLRAQDRHAGQLLTDAQRATDALEDAESEYTGPSVADAEKLLELCADDTREAFEALGNLRRQLVEAESRFKKCEADVEHAKDILKTAASHEKVIANLRTQRQDGQNVKRVDAAELANASEAVTAARLALERGALVRKAKEQLAAAELSTKVALAHRTQANKLRTAAQGTDEVLSEVVAKTGSKLRVEAGRLVLDTHRGATYFADLSHGERWKIALDIAIEAVGEGGLLVVDQVAWEGLDGINRKLISEHVKGSGVVLLTAEADDGTLRAEVYASDGV